MKTATLKILKLFSLLLLLVINSTFSYAQSGNSQIFVYYPGSPNPIVFGSTINVSSNEVEITVRNIPTNGNPSLTLNSDTWLQFSNGNLGLKPNSIITNASLSQGSYNLKASEYFKFTIRKLNNTCGSYSTKITITSNASNYTNGIFEFYIAFTNAPAISVLGGTPTQTVPNGQTIPTSFNGTTFGTVDVGSSAQRTYVITNTGTCPLTLNSLTLHGYVPGSGSTGIPSSEFSIATLTASTINPGGVGYLIVNYIPTTSGTHHGIITIPNNDSTKNPYTYVIGGEGFNPTITGPGGLVADFRLWLKSTRGIFATNNTSINRWRDLGSQSKDALAYETNKPLFLDNQTDNINFNPVVKFTNNGSTDQFMYNLENGFYSQEIFIVMLPDANVDVTASPGISVFSGKDDISPNGNTGIGMGDYTSRITGERLWFNQWNTTATNKYYALGSSSTSFNTQKVGLINAHNKTTTPADGMILRYDAIDIGDLVPTTPVNSTFYNIGYLDEASNKIFGAPYMIGKSYTDSQGSFNGRIAEILTYAKQLLPQERPRVESYLAIKYGITLGVNGTSQNYVNSGGVIVWNVSENTGFNYNIAGIAKDVNSDLFQKQSKSVNDSNEVTIGLGAIFLTNSANINEFNQDLDYLVWGSNNGTITADGSNTMTIKSGVTTSVTRINKKWKIVESGTGDVGTVIVSIPASTLTSTFPKLTTEEYTLIVSDNSAFGDTSIIDVIPLKSDGNGNLTTWYDFDGTKYFTFGKAPNLEGSNLVNIEAGDYLVEESGLNLNSGSFSVSCWIRNNGTSATNRTIIAKGSDLIFRLNSNHKLEALWDGASKLISNTEIRDGKWHHVVAVYSLGSAFLYIDGVLDNSSFNVPSPNPNFHRFSVGATYASKGAGITDHFRGEIDELHIWDNKLSVNQINYLMNQEIVKHSDATANGKILPQTLVKNELKTIPWSQLKAYYDFNSFYGTTVAGLTDDNNFLRIRYLDKDKTVVESQTAPLPYETIADGTWSTEAVWKNGTLQKIPNDNSIIAGSPQLTVDGNIVKINHNITSIGNKTLLALYVDGVDISNYKYLSAENDSKVEVTHYLKLDGLIDLQGKSQLIQTTDSELDATSKGFIKRSQEGTGNLYNYNYWSSPVGPINSTTNNNNYTLNGVFKSGTNSSPQSINWISGYNGSVSGQTVSLARYWLWKFENGTQYANWVQFNENGALRPSQGFTLKGAGGVGTTQNYTFIGKPFNGTISSNSVLANNFYLVGNPYPSAIDSEKFINDNIDVISGTIYIWEHSPANNTHNLGGYTGGYSTITLTGGTGPVAPAGIKGLGNSAKIPKKYIPIGQAFYVGGKSGLSGATPIIFNNGQRLFVKEDALDDAGAAISNNLIRNNGNNKTVQMSRFVDNSNHPIYNDQYVKIRLGVITPNNYYRELLIGFLEYEASDGIDKGYDGAQIDTQNNDAYFLIDKTNFNIQGVGRFNQTKKYPIGIKTAIAGVTKIKIDAVEFLNADQKVYIHDKETNVYHDITKQAVDLNLPIGVYNDRFVLTFNDGTIPEYGFEEIGIHESLLISSANNIEEEFNLSDNSLNVYMNNSEIKIHIQKTSGVEIKNLEIYNMLGQLIFNVNKFNNSNSVTLDFPTNTSAGVYLVKVFTNEGIHAKKILKN